MGKTVSKYSVKIKDFLLLLFLISISAFRLNIYIALTAYMLILIYSIMFDHKIAVTNILKWGIVFWGYYLLSSIWSNNPSDTFRYFSAIVYILGIYIFLPKIVTSKEEIDNVIKLIFYSIAFTAIYLLIITPLSQFGIERLGTTIGLNENAFGIRMAIGAFISFYILKNNDIHINKFFLIAFLIIFIILTLFSGSKKALVFVTLSIFAMEFMNASGLKKLFKTSLITILIIGLLFLIFNNKNLYSVIGYRIERTFLTLNQSNSNNTTLIINNGSVGTTDKSLLERKFYIKEANELFKKNVLIGYGGNGFVTHMREIGYYHVAYSHNNYTELLCTLGIVGFLIYYSYWLVTLFRLIKIRRQCINFTEKKTATFFIIIIMMLLILDYGCVSYILEFNLLLLCLADIFVNKMMKGVK